MIQDRCSSQLVKVLWGMSETTFRTSEMLVPGPCGLMSFSPGSLQQGAYLTESLPTAPAFGRPRTCVQGQHREGNSRARVSRLQARSSRHPEHERAHTTKPPETRKGFDIASRVMHHVNVEFSHEAQISLHPCNFGSLKMMSSSLPVTDVWIASPNICSR